MRRYEAVIVINAELGESKMKDEIARLQAQIEGLGGSNVKADRWGNREVGSHMRKPTIGHYVCFTFETENTALTTTLRESLSITDSVLKFQTLRVADRVRKVRGYVRKDGAASDTDGVEEGAGF